MRIINLKCLWLILLTISSEYLFGQSMPDDSINKNRNSIVDSLLLAVKKEKTDSAKLKQYYDWVPEIYLPSDAKSWDTAMYYANQALALANTSNFKKGKGWVLNLLGYLSWVKFNYANALKFYFEVLKIPDAINDKSFARNVYYNIGRVYGNIHNRNEALKYYLKALEMAREDRANYQEIREYLGYAGMVYQNLGNYTEALKCYNEYIEVHNKNSKYQVGDSLIARYIGTVYKDMNNYPEALHYLFMALKYFLRDGFKNQICLIYSDIGTVYCKQAAELNDKEAIEKYKEAIEVFNKSIKVSYDIDFRNTRSDAYKGLSISYAGIGDSKNALQYLNLYLQLKDSLDITNEVSKMTDIKTQYELEKMQIEDKTRQDLLLANEKSTREKLLGEEKLKQEKILFDERVLNEKKIAEQKLEEEKAIAIAGEKAKYDKSVAIEKLRNEKRQTNNLLLMGLILVVITFVLLTFFFRQRNQKKRAVEKAEATHKMAELEMQSLRSQLNPHFMFNSLNSLQRLILMEESDKSQSYLVQFSKMLRMLLDNADKAFIPLHKEIDFLQLYLGLEKMRVPDLEYSISTDPSLNINETLIPNMTLQPYVENAIWHGLSHKEHDKKLQIRIYRENGTVNCEVEDNGIGRKKAEELKSLFRKQHQSKGMELLTKRFKLLNEEYGSNIEAIISDKRKNDEDCGTLVTIKIPVMQTV